MTASQAICMPAKQVYRPRSLCWHKSLLTKFVLHRGSMTFILGVDVVLTHLWRRPDRTFAVVHKHSPLYRQVPAVQRPGKAAGDAAGALRRVGQLLLPVPSRRRPGRAVGHGLGAFAPAFTTLPWHSRVKEKEDKKFCLAVPGQLWKLEPPATNLHKCCPCIQLCAFALAHPCVVCGMPRHDCGCLIALLEVTMRSDSLISTRRRTMCGANITARPWGGGCTWTPARLPGTARCSTRCARVWILRSRLVAESHACNGRICARGICPLAKHQFQVSQSGQQSVLERCPHLRGCLQAGWGKQQSYVVAFGLGGVADVTRRYTADYAAAQTRRTKVSEQWLANAIGGVTGQLRASLPAEERRGAEARDAAEAAQLRAGTGGGAAAAAQQDLPGAAVLREADPDFHQVSE